MGIRLRNVSECDAQYQNFLMADQAMKDAAADRTAARENEATVTAEASAAIEAAATTI